MKKIFLSIMMLLFCSAAMADNTIIHYCDGKKPNISKKFFMDLRHYAAANTKSSIITISKVADNPRILRFKVDMQRNHGYTPDVVLVTNSKGETFYAAY